MSVIPRMSGHMSRILRIMAERTPGSTVDARDLLGAAGLPPGIGYPIVHRLCDRGLLRRHWEDIDPVVEGRPRSCHYTLTTLGFAHLVAAGGNLSSTSRSRQPKAMSR
jgi:DNA-binding PadR family transcriptional regulator